MRRSTYNPNCNVCSGSGRIKVLTPVKDIGTFLTSLAEELVPFLASTKKCWKCKGSGIYSGYQRMR